MKNKKVIRRIAAAIILCVILLCIIISYFKRNISGNQLLNYMLTENISTIEIRKTRENSNGFVYDYIRNKILYLMQRRERCPDCSNEVL